MRKASLSRGCSGHLLPPNSQQYTRRVPHHPHGGSWENGRGCRPIPIPANKDKDQRMSEVCLTPNRILKSELDNTKECVTTTEDASSESSLENFDVTSMSSEPSFSSLEFELKDRDVDTGKACFQDVFSMNDEGKQNKQFCQEFSEFTFFQLEAQEERAYRSVNWQFSVDDYRCHLGFSGTEEEEQDTEEEEEEEQEYQWCMFDDVYKTPDKSESPTEVAQEEILWMSGIETVMAYLRANSSPERNVASGVSVNSGSPRLFRALFDYDSTAMSPISDEEEKGELDDDEEEKELSFLEGQIIMVTGDKDPHGIYRGEYGGKKGLIPCKLVLEIHIEV